jgi:hypothetical protein
MPKAPEKTETADAAKDRADGSSADAEKKSDPLLDRLITVDVVCHAVPSPLVWERYLEMQRKKLGTGISDAKFRDKHFGYNYSTMTLLDERGQERYVQGIDTDQMLRAFSPTSATGLPAMNAPLKSVTERVTSPYGTAIRSMPSTRSWMMTRAHPAS